jgi:hypothetical protein
MMIFYSIGIKDVIGRAAEIGLLPALMAWRYSFVSRTHLSNIK